MFGSKIRVRHARAIKIQGHDIPLSCYGIVISLQRVKGLATGGMGSGANIVGNRAKLRRAISVGYPRQLPDTRCHRASRYLATNSLPNKSGNTAHIAGADITSSHNSLREDKPMTRPDKMTHTVTALSGISLALLGASAQALDFGSGDMTSLAFKGLHDLQFNYKRMGFFTRFKYWYDSAYTEAKKRSLGPEAKFASATPPRLSAAGV
jgi:hypothetical protein